MNVINTSCENLSKLVLICRLCGDASDSYKNIFGHDGIKNCIDKKIFTYLKVKVNILLIIIIILKIFIFLIQHTLIFLIQISNSDLLPKIICDKCFNKLDEFHNFFLKSKKVQSLLKNTINESLFKIKIKIGLPGSEIPNSNKNYSTKNDYKIYSFDEEQHNTEIENHLIHKEKLFSLNNQNDDIDKERNSEFLPMSIDKNICKNSYVESNEISNFQNTDNLLNVNNENTKINVVKYTEKNNENSLSLSYNNISCDLQSTLTDNSCKSIDYNNSNMNMHENDIKAMDLMSAHTKNWMNDRNKHSTREFESDVISAAISWPCISCTEVFIHVKELIKHYKEQHHCSIPTFKCSMCGKMYKILKHFYEHYKKHNTINKHT
jgi:hypothetical protein